MLTRQIQHKNPGKCTVTTHTSTNRYLSHSQMWMKRMEQQNVWPVAYPSDTFLLNQFIEETFFRERAN